MKKIWSIMIIALYVFTVLFMTYFSFHMDKVIIVSLIFFIALLISIFESKDSDARTMALVATLSALAGVLRVPANVIPGFNPITFITAVAGYSLGGINGFMVGSMSAFISNLFLGQGPWTLWQMLAWGLCGLCFGYSRKLIEKLGFKSFVFFCGLWGIIFGLILNQWYIVSYIRPLTIKSIFIGLAAAIPHDILHAVGNVILASIFGKEFIRVLDRYMERKKVIYLD